MSFNSYRLYRRASGAFSLLCAVLFFIFYFNNYLLFEESLSAYAKYYDTLEYVRYAISDLINFLIPTLSALLLAPALFYERVYRLCLPSLLLCASWAVYYLPYYYLYYLLNGYDSIDATLTALPLSLLFSLLYAAYTLALAFIAKTVFLSRGNLCDYPKSAPALSLSHPVTASIFSIVIIHFGVVLASELFDVITFFIEYADNYRLGELLAIIGSLLFILLCMLAAHFTCVFVHKKVISERFYDEAEDE